MAMVSGCALRTVQRLNVFDRRPTHLLEWFLLAVFSLPRTALHKSVFGWIAPEPQPAMNL
jgi:hypothetical protein